MNNKFKNEHKQNKGNRSNEGNKHIDTERKQCCCESNYEEACKVHQENSNPVKEFKPTQEQTERYHSLIDEVLNIGVDSISYITDELQICGKTPAEFDADCALMELELDMEDIMQIIEGSIEKIKGSFEEADTEHRKQLKAYLTELSILYAQLATGAESGVVNNIVIDNTITVLVKDEIYLDTTAFVITGMKDLLNDLAEDEEDEEDEEYEEFEIDTCENDIEGIQTPMGVFIIRRQ